MKVARRRWQITAPIGSSPALHAPARAASSAARISSSIFVVAPFAIAPGEAISHRFIEMRVHFGQSRVNLARSGFAQVGGFVLAIAHTESTRRPLRGRRARRKSCRRQRRRRAAARPIFASPPLMMSGAGLLLCASSNWSSRLRNNSRHSHAARRFFDRVHYAAFARCGERDFAGRALFAFSMISNAPSKTWSGSDLMASSR